MAIERIYHCDGPECERHVRTMKPWPPSFIQTREENERGLPLDQHYFCSWDCVLRFAAEKEPTEVIPVEEAPDAA